MNNRLRSWWMAPLVAALIFILFPGLLPALLNGPATARASHPDGVIYVDAGASGADDGSSWPDAYTSLQAALAHATGGDELWVAAGVYTPGSVVSDTFQLKNSVAIYGGFAASETERSERDWQTNLTVLSGDIDANDVTDPTGVVSDTASIVGDNSLHVVTGSGADATAILDGVTVCGGQADGSFPANTGGGMYNVSGSPTLTNVTFSGNDASSGGGMFNTGGSTPTLVNVTFSGNTASSSGGGMFNSNSSTPLLVNVTFSGNDAVFSGGGMFNISGGSPTLANVTFSGNDANHGGGMFNSNSSPALANVTFSGNEAGSSGGGMYNDNNSSPTLVNVTFSANTAATNGGGGISNVSSSPSVRNSIVSGNLGGQIVNTGSSDPTVEYSLVEGGYPDGANIIDENARFVDPDGPDDIPGTADDNLRLRLDSPAVDAGKNSFVPSDTLDLDEDGNTSEPLPLDLDGGARFVDIPSQPDSGDGTPPIVDMGAYESDPPAPTATATPTNTATRTQTATPTATAQATETATGTGVATATGTRTPTATGTIEASRTATTATATQTPTRTGTVEATRTMTTTASVTATAIGPANQLYLPLVRR